MNDQNPAAAPAEPSPAPYKDRSAGLVVFGILTLLLGVLAGLVILLVLVGQAAAANLPNPPPRAATLLPVIAVYGTLAVALVWLGIGSIMARRWARALLLIFSWSWLVMGVFTIGILGFVMPKVLANLPPNATNGQPALPAGAIVGVMIVMFLVFGVLFVILPAVWTFFYNSPHVKATCESRDPVTRWTDACPLPVLGLCLWLSFAVPMMLLMPIAAHGTMPFFGMFLTGLPGSVFCIFIAVVWSYAAWRLYRLDVRGWWLILIALVVFMVSSVLTYARHDVVEMYQLMGYPEAQIEQIKQTGLLQGNRMSWFMVLSVLPFLGYLLFIKKFLHGKAGGS